MSSIPFSSLKKKDGIFGRQTGLWGRWVACRRCGMGLLDSHADLVPIGVVHLHQIFLPLDIITIRYQ